MLRTETVREQGRPWLAPHARRAALGWRYPSRGEAALSPVRQCRRLKIRAPHAWSPPGEGDGAWARKPQKRGDRRKPRITSLTDCARIRNWRGAQRAFRVSRGQGDSLYNRAARWPGGEPAWQTRRGAVPCGGADEHEQGDDRHLARAAAHRHRQGLGHGAAPARRPD